MKDSDKAAIRANRAAWDASAPLHRGTTRWRELATGFATPGYSVLDATVTGILRDLGIAGRSVVQVGCNNGRELLSLAGMGAGPCLGIDQSAAFLDQARDLAAISGHDVRFLCADIHALPADTPGGFDLCLITIGVLNWMPDLDAFFAALADLVRAGGDLVIYETHPILDMFDPHGPDPYRPTASYFRAEPYVETETITYDGSQSAGAAPSHWFPHPMGRIVTAAASAGFAVQSLTEYPHSNREVDYDLFQGQTAQLPMCYSFVARRSA